MNQPGQTDSSLSIDISLFYSGYKLLPKKGKRFKFKLPSYSYPFLYI